VVQVSGGALGAHKQRRPVNQDQIQIFRGNRVDTIFRAGLRALLFFFEIFVFQDAWKKSSSRRSAHDGNNQPDPAQL
jgi:hypothetical protein